MKSKGFGVGVEAKGHLTHLEKLQKFANSPDKQPQPAPGSRQRDGFACRALQGRGSPAAPLAVFSKQMDNLSCVIFVAQMFLCAEIFRSMQISHMP